MCGSTSWNRDRCDLQNRARGPSAMTRFAYIGCATARSASVSTTDTTIELSAITKPDLHGLDRSVSPCRMVPVCNIKRASCLHSNSVLYHCPTPREIRAPHGDLGSTQQKMGLWVTSCRSTAQRSA
ncbi:unnamed protein product [Phytophthora fragariaefolia]|uniref:Unnamed protein product n=1 Tax=Phytophthora fragariaefolia TaxID=1490495 RepID=A0A9W6XXA7_9STRA|nr:unnamed protein product [Phytophthora fragariaefolia]